MYMNFSYIMQDSLSSLYVASQEGHAEVVATLLSHGADPNLATMVRGMVCLFHPFTTSYVLV